MVLFLLFFLMLRLSVVQQGRRRLLYILKQRKTNLNVSDRSSSEARLFTGERKRW